jgi:hypothetical protein
MKYYDLINKYYTFTKFSGFSYATKFPCQPYSYNFEVHLNSSY